MRIPELKGLLQNNSLSKEMSEIIPFAADSQGTLPGQDLSLDSLLRKILKDQLALVKSLKAQVHMVSNWQLPLPNQKMLNNIQALCSMLADNNIYRTSSAIGMLRFKLKKLVMKGCTKTIDMPFKTLV